MEHPPTIQQLQTTDQTFVALPSDPSVPLTQEQLDSVFGGEHRLLALRDLMRRLNAVRVPVRQDESKGAYDAQN